MERVILWVIGAAWVVIVVRRIGTTPYLAAGVILVHLQELCNDLCIAVAQLLFGLIDFFAVY